jgi:hypothetical protein
MPDVTDTADSTHVYWRIIHTVMDLLKANELEGADAMLLVTMVAATVLHNEHPDERAGLLEDLAAWAPKYAADLDKESGDLWQITIAAVEEESKKG